ncbi:hypothetical protein VNO77_04074 [Canavalia gladiata]|uniref:Uncharacterized protein n=1 Tax=Canavalia gladiata TaxID=3824 RepID=A0AAN9N113_CANGL
MVLVAQSWFIATDLKRILMRVDNREFFHAFFVLVAAYGPCLSKLNSLLLYPCLISHVKRCHYNPKNPYLHAKRNELEMYTSGDDENDQEAEPLTCMKTVTNGISLLYRCDVKLFTLIILE